MGLLDDKAKEIVKDHMLATMKRVPVKSGACRYNFRCQRNAVHEALEAGHDEIAMCMYLEGDNPIIHFLNVDKDGNYTDNTLGQWSQRYTYFLVRHIDKESFFSIESIFSSYRRDLKLKMPLHVRLFSNVEF